MTTDQLMPAQKAVSGFTPGYFYDFGWGFGMAVRTRRTHLGPPSGATDGTSSRPPTRRSTTSLGWLTNAGHLRAAGHLGLGATRTTFERG
jgi:hypothetical protein